MSGSKNDLGFAAVRSCPLPPRYVQRSSPHLFCGEVSPHSSLWSYAPHTRTDFSYTRKVSKSVCKGQPLAKPRGGNTSRLVCLRHTQPCFPAVTFGHAPLLHLGSFLRQQGGTCPLGHCGGSRHREAVTFPPEEIFKRTPPLENAFGYFYRFIKVAAGAGCNDKAKPWRNPAREGYGEPSP